MPHSPHRPPPPPNEPTAEGSPGVPRPPPTARCKHWSCTAAGRAVGDRGTPAGAPQVWGEEEPGREGAQEGGAAHRPEPLTWSTGQPRGPGLRAGLRPRPGGGCAGQARCPEGPARGPGPVTGGGGCTCHHQQLEGGGDGAGGQARAGARAQEGTSEAPRPWDVRGGGQGGSLGGRGRRGPHGAGGQPEARGSSPWGAPGGAATAPLGRAQGAGGPGPCRWQPAFPARAAPCQQHPQLGERRGTAAVLAEGQPVGLGARQSRGLFPACVLGKWLYLSGPPFSRR